ncbi:MAG: ACT domain-containing protein, partial [Methylocystaceae bacterium]
AAIVVDLNDEVIDIFTDVDGIMTADPRIVKDARLLTMVTYNELCQLAREGAKVIHPRAVEIAMQRNVPLRVRSTFSDSTGTLVCSGNGMQDMGVDIERDHVITGITQTPHISQIKIMLALDENNAQIQLKVFKAMALANISVDFINVSPELISYTVSRDDAERAREILDTMGIKAQVTSECAKVAVVGAAMTGIPGVMSRVVEALVANQIPILQTGDSYTNIWCLVPAPEMEKAVTALHARFSLGLE